MRTHSTLYKITRPGTGPLISHARGLQGPFGRKFPVNSTPKDLDSHRLGNQGVDELVDHGCLDLLRDFKACLPSGLCARIAQKVMLKD